MLRLLRSFGICFVVGLTVGVVVGGSLGRVFMRLVFLAEQDTLGFQTAMGATVGEFTSGGTAAIYVFGGIAGAAFREGHARESEQQRQQQDEDTHRLERYRSSRTRQCRKIALERTYGTNRRTTMSS